MVSQTDLVFLGMLHGLRVTRSFYPTATSYGDRLNLADELEIDQVQVMGVRNMQTFGR